MEFLRAISILLNTLLGGKSSETLCGRTYRVEQHGSKAARHLRKALDALFFFQSTHCAESHRADVARAKQLTRKADNLRGVIEHGH